MEQAVKPKKKLTKKRIFMGIGVILLALLGSCVYTAMTTKPTIPATTVGYGEITSTLSSKATVSSDGLEEYIVPETTEVAKVYFKNGDPVKAGDLIVEYDNSTALNTYKRAAIAYEQSRLSLAETERKYFDLKEDLDETIENIEFYRTKWKQWEDHTDPEGVANYNTYFTKWEAAKQQKKALEDSIPSADFIKSQQLSFELAKMTLDEAEEVKNSLPSNIVAKSDGVIQSIAVKDYGTAPKGTVAVAVKTTNTDTVDFTIGRYDVTKVQVGMPAIVTIGTREYTGQVSHIDPVAGADSSIKAKVKLDDPTGIVPGISADLEIEIYHAENVLTLPIEAVKTDRSGDYCYILNQNEDGTYTPVRTYITIGQSSNMAIEVLEGISEGQMIASNPAQNIEMMPIVNIIPQG